MKADDINAAVSSPKAALFMALGLAACLIFPALGVFDPAETYLEVWRTNPSFPYLYKQTYLTTGAVDVVLAGSSPVMHGMRPELLKKPFEQMLGRPVEIHTVGVEFWGEDAIYLVLKNFMERRPVRMVVMTGPQSWQTNSTPHVHAHRFWLYPENRKAYEGLPWLSRCSFYAAALLGTPRHLLSFIRPNVPAAEFDERFAATGLAQTFGATHSTRMMDGGPFRAVDFDPPFLEAAAMMSYGGSDSRFQFLGPELTPFQKHFHRRIAALAVEHGAKLVYLNMPVLYGRHNTQVVERVDWAALSPGAGIRMLGIPGRVLFQNLSERDIAALYWDENHLNDNGARFYTRAVASGLMEAFRN